MFLKKALYELRDADIDALREFESACVAHDREMPQIRKAMIREYGGVATLWTHRQMAICKKKSKDFGGGVEWCRRGLAIYGTDAIPQDRPMVTDLERRLAWFEQQLR